MRHTSAHRDVEIEVQTAYERGAAETRDAIGIWLTRHADQPEFAAVALAFRADWYEPKTTQSQGETT